jgi:probable F420-dependent oxidoreductase
MTHPPQLSPIGIWSPELRFGDPAETADAAAELEELGFGALWIPDVGGPVLESVEHLLRATTRLTVATGILNVWMHDAADVAAGQERLGRAFPGRFLLGLGISHAPIVDAEQPGRYRRPLATMREYLDELDAAAADGTRLARVLAALGPKMLELARERTLGSHPYLVPVEHTAAAREALGPDRLLAPSLSAVLAQDLGAARAVAREDLATYLQLPNYTNAWQRLGYGDDELAGGGSDRLVESLYALGSAERIAERVREHREAGADHVCVRVVGGSAERLPRAEWRELAPAVIV